MQDNSRIFFPSVCVRGCKPRVCVCVCVCVCVYVCARTHVCADGRKQEEAKIFTRAFCNKLITKNIHSHTQSYFQSNFHNTIFFCSSGSKLAMHQCRIKIRETDKKMC